MDADVSIKDNIEVRGQLREDIKKVRETEEKQIYKDKRGFWELVWNEDWECVECILYAMEGSYTPNPYVIRTDNDDTYNTA